MSCTGEKKAQSQALAAAARVAGDQVDGAQRCIYPRCNRPLNTQQECPCGHSQCPTDVARSLLLESRSWLSNRGQSLLTRELAEEDAALARAVAAEQHDLLLLEEAESVLARLALDRRQGRARAGLEAELERAHPDSRWFCRIVGAHALEVWRNEQVAGMASLLDAEAVIQHRLDVDRLLENLALDPAMAAAQKQARLAAPANQRRVTLRAERRAWSLADPHRPVIDYLERLPTGSTMTVVEAAVAGWPEAEALRGQWTAVETPDLGRVWVPLGEPPGRPDYRLTRDFGLLGEVTNRVSDALEVGPDLDPTDVRERVRRADYNAVLLEVRREIEHDQADEREIDIILTGMRRSPVATTEEMLQRLHDEQGAPPPPEVWAALGRLETLVQALRERLEQGTPPVECRLAWQRRLAWVRSIQRHNLPDVRRELEERGLAADRWSWRSNLTGIEGMLRWVLARDADLRLGDAEMHPPVEDAARASPRE